MSMARFYVGTYTAGGARGIYKAWVDLCSGALVLEDLAAELENPSFLVADRARQRLYSVSEVNRFEGQDTGAVFAFAVDERSGDLRPLNRVASAGSGPCHLSLDSGRCLFVSNYVGGSLASLPIGSDGSLEQASCVIRHQGKGADPERQSSPHAHCTVLAPSGDLTMATDLGLDRVFAYRYDRTARRLLQESVDTIALSRGAGPRHMAFHPELDVAYVVNELNSTVNVLTHDCASSALTLVQEVSTLPLDTEVENDTAEILISRDGRFVYVSNRGHDSIASFAVDPRTGQLSPTGHQSAAGRTPRNFVIHPDGTLMLVANENSGTVVSFFVDGHNGGLSGTGHQLDVPSPVCVCFWGC